MVTSTSSISSPSQFTYDPRSRRYRDQNSGRFVAAKEVRSAVDTIIDKEAITFRSVAQQLVDGQINLAEFQIQMQANVKRLHVAMALAANGGLANTSPGDLGFIGGLLKEQYQFLRDMSKQIKNGTQKLDGTLLARAELYAQASRGSFEKVKERAAKIGGQTQQKSMLGMADHCSECVGEAAKGWSAIGSLTPVGERICKANCHCSMQYK